MNAADLEICQGRVSAELAAEFPALRLFYCTVAADTRRSPKYIREQLAHMSNRVVGDYAISLRGTPVAHAYRVFFRQIGIDPDEHRIPLEVAIEARLQAGRFRSTGLLADVITVAIVESGVALVAFDARSIEGAPQLRLSVPGDDLFPAGVPRSEGTIVIADRQRPIAPLFGMTMPDATPSKSTTTATICAIAVATVPEIVVEEALWKCHHLLSSAR